jgi:tol-pal system protein YbgF
MKPNKVMPWKVLLGVAALMLMLQPTVWARMNKQETGRFEEMVSRLEQAESRLNSNNLRQQKMFQQLESMSTENRSLRGEIEQINHQIRQMEKRQRELYLDMEQRLQALESNAGVATGKRKAGNTDSMAAAGGGMNETTDNGAFVEESPAQPDEQSQYRQAFEMLKSGQHQAAISGFETFVKTYPDSNLTANAQYWLGEAHYGAAQFEQAVREFEKVRTIYPGTAKVGDASLKLAYSYYELKQWDGSRSVLNEINKSFPGSTVAKLAKERLKRMKREGH